MVMKKLILLIFICFSTIILLAQDITISFRPKVSGTLIDSIWVINQRTGQSIKLAGNESLILTNATRINHFEESQTPGLIYPNPSNGEVTMSFTSVIPGKVRVEVYTVLGQLLATSKQILNPGGHIYKINFPGEGIYFVSVFKNDGILTFKTFQKANEKKECKIIYEGSEGPPKSKNALIEKTLIYSPGDILFSSVELVRFSWVLKGFG